MNRARLRTRVIAAAFVIAVALVWWFFAPTSIGGSTRYVTTSGVSMEPRFHTGDLAIVRPATSYHVGEIVAYHSSLLHLTVLHRIIGRDGARYVFKGDNNNFIDPTRPTRAQLLGVLWIHVPHGGVVLKLLHSPVVAAILCLGLGVLLLAGIGEKRRRRRRTRSGAKGFGRPGAPPVKTSSQHRVTRAINYGAFLTAAAIAGVVFVLLGMIAFSRPLHKGTVVNTPYTQQVHFSYSAHTAPGPVYPSGSLNTGDPIFPQLVHRVNVQVNYRLKTAAPHAVSGTENILLKLIGPGGWNRRLVLTPPTRFSADHTSTAVMLDLPRIQALLTRVAKLTGLSSYDGFTISVVPEVHLVGTVAGQTVNARFKPNLAFQLSANQILPGAASSSSPQGASSNGSHGLQSGYSQSEKGSVTNPAVIANTLAMLGVSPEISLLRWIATVGLVLSIAAAILCYLGKRGQPFEETFRIQAQYGHMIVPIVGGEDLGWPPVDVPNIKALVKLAESGQRLILHNRSDNVDTYMVNEEGTVYRYQVRPSNVVWGEWSDTGAEVEAAAA